MYCPGIRWLPPPCANTGASSTGCSVGGSRVDGGSAQAARTNTESATAKRLFMEGPPRYAAVGQDSPARRRDLAAPFPADFSGAQKLQALAGRAIRQNVPGSAVLRFASRAREPV